METEYDEGADYRLDATFGEASAIAGGAEFWSTDTSLVVVFFDTGGKAVFGSFTPLRPSTKSTWAKWRDRAEFLWRRWFP